MMGNTCRVVPLVNIEAVCVAGVRVCKTPRLKRAGGSFIFIYGFILFGCEAGALMGESLYDEIDHSLTNEMAN